MRKYRLRIYAGQLEFFILLAGHFHIIIIIEPIMIDIVSVWWTEKETVIRESDNFL